MRLPKLFSKSDPAKKYLHILLSDNAVRSALVSVLPKGVAVLSQSKTHQYTSSEECIESTDLALQELDNGAEKVEEVILALDANWVNETGIADQRKGLLKQLTEKLALTAVGFVVIPEAILKAYGSGDNESMLLILVHQQKVSLYLVHKGIVEKAETVGRTLKHAGDVFEGIARFKQVLGPEETLPSKIVISSFEVENSELDEIKQELISANWGEQKIFREQPVIETITSNQLTEMIVAKGGEAVARAHGLSSMSQPVAETALDDEAGATATASSFGVPISQPAIPVEGEDELEVAEHEVNLTTAQQKKNKLKKIIIGGVIAGLFVVFLILYFTVRVMAQVTIVITPKLTSVSKQVEVTVDSTIDSSDPDNLILAGDTITTTVNGEDTIATTGRKLVGDPAKGSVTIYNKTSSEKTFPSGTELSSGDLVFTTDQEVTIPAAEINDSNPNEVITKSGKLTVAGTAKEIGEEGNIKKDVKMTVQSFTTSTYEAVANEDFAGGSSREAKVVSEEDQAKLLQELRTALISAGQEKLESEVESGLFVLPTQNITVTGTSYSGDVGEEADELGLSATATVRGIAYAAEDLRPIAQAALTPELQPGYKLTEEDPDVLSQPIENEDEDDPTQRLTLNISSQATPDLSEDQIEQAVAGLSASRAVESLLQNQAVQSVEIKFKPPIAGMLKVSVPNDPEKIILEIK